MAYGPPVAGFCIATALFTCGATGFPNPPAQLPPSSGTLTMSSGAQATVAPGASLTLTGAGFASRARVTVAVYSSPQLLDHVVATSTGQVTATVTLPTDLRGHHTVTAVGDGPADTAHVLEAAVDVQPATSSTGSLAQTGFNALEWALGGLAMLVAGFALIRTVGFRRRLLPTRR
ncbi:MAG TPA: hypothetical protein VFM01_11145 [Nakamurella sp.]|nr:hypothetical protein [Nakamurella sp.]